MNTQRNSNSILPGALIGTLTAFVALFLLITMGTAGAYGALLLAAGAAALLSRVRGGSGGAAIANAVVCLATTVGLAVGVAFVVLWIIFSGATFTF